jgi:hypothetical protein
MRRIFILSLALLCTLLVTGCFEIEQTLNIDKDLSGTADFHLGVDLEPMIVVMAQFGRAMEGKEGPATAEEIAKAKEDFRKNSKKSTDAGKPPSKEEIAKDLPAGVKLLDFQFKEREFGMDSDFKFAFDKLSSLVNVKLPQKKEGSADPTQKSVIESPFEGLEVSESGNTLTIRAKAQNPTETVEKETEAEAPKMDKDTEKLMRDAFKKLRVVYRITAPFEVVSHNATRREGNTLIWEYDLETFEKLEKAKKLDDATLRVTYKR